MKVKFADCDAELQKIARAMLAIWARDTGFGQACGLPEEKMVDGLLELIDAGLVRMVCDDITERGIDNLRIEPDWENLASIGLR